MKISYKRSTEQNSVDRMRLFMSDLGNPQNTYSVIHVAGTSGKTSTCYYASNMLIDSGLKVGMTVSPYVHHVEERLQIDGSGLPEHEYCQLLTEFLSRCNNFDKVKPTYLELNIAFAFWVFAQKKVDCAVVEVGVGGAYDATNVIVQKNKTCLITDIGFDHVELLGNTLTSIALHKAGIIQSENYVHMHQQIPEVEQTIARYCKEIGAHFNIIKRSDHEKFGITRLTGFQIRNWLLAAEGADVVLRNVFKRSLHCSVAHDAASTQIPGRMEIFHCQNATFILDGAHNPQKMSALISTLNESYGLKNVCFLVSFVKGKESVIDRCKSTVYELSCANQPVVISEFGSKNDIKQSLPANVVGDYFGELGFKKHVIKKNLADAVKYCSNLNEPVIVATGSLYFLNVVRNEIQMFR